MDEAQPLVRVSALCILQCLNTDDWVAGGNQAHKNLIPLIPELVGV